MAWSPVAEGAGGGTGSSSTVVCTLDGAVSVGQTVFAAVTWDTQSGNVTHVTGADQLGNTYTTATNPINPGAQEGQGLVSIITNAGTPTITATLRDAGGSATAATDRVIIAQAFSGSDSSSVLDDAAAQAMAPGTVAPDAITSGNLTTTVNGALLWSGCFNASTGSDPGLTGTGFTLGVTTTTPYTFDAEYREVATAGTVAGTWTSASGDEAQTRLVIAMAVTPAGGGGGTVGRLVGGTLAGRVLVGGLLLGS